MNEAEGTLSEQATGFATDLTAMVFGVLGDVCAPFRATMLAGSGRTRFAVRQYPDTGIPLPLPDDEVVTLLVSYLCARDSAGVHMRVDKSTFAVYFGPAAGIPLFRYDYDATRGGHLPRAHLQVPHDRQDLAAVVSLAGDATPLARKRSRDIALKGRLPRPDDLHFPVGGDRFRPALEDVLQILIDVLGVRARDGWRNVIIENRREWRTKQLKAAVRDHPGAAVTALEQLGYLIQCPEGGHPAPTDRSLNDI